MTTGRVAKKMLVCHYAFLGLSDIEEGALVIRRFSRNAERRTNNMVRQRDAVSSGLVVMKRYETLRATNGCVSSSVLA